MLVRHARVTQAGRSDTFVPSQMHDAGHPDLLCSALSRSVVGDELWGSDPNFRERFNLSSLLLPLSPTHELLAFPRNSVCHSSRAAHTTNRRNRHNS